jgi:trehalose synthase-fused probable maltokinase
MAGGGTLRYGDADDMTGRAVGEAGEQQTITPLGAEQSNTSLRFDRTLVFKLVRRLENGENPELEVSRFLSTRTTFRAAALLRGSLTYTPRSGESSTIGILQDWIDSSGDGWAHVVASLRRPDAWPSAEPLLPDLRALAATTADFHAALASDPATPAFAPEPMTVADVETWRASLLARAARTFGLIERRFTEWTGDVRRLSEALLDLRGRLATLAAAPDSMPLDAFCKIRIHGDYHLGQALRTRHGFVLIDFEGEPARPLADRRLKHCALKDVAGMIRSFDYAVAVACDGGCGELDSEACTRRLRESFVDAYVARAMERRVAFLPHDRRAIEAWIDFFEIEKALYEVEYEINNRPAWVRIPLSGLVRILRRQA